MNALCSVLSCTVVLVWLLGEGAWCQEDPLVVSTSQGAVRGVQTVSPSGRISSKFLGVPYARPPVGSYRFQPPVAHTPWDGTLYASHYGAACPQRDDIWRHLVGDWMYEKYVSTQRYNEDCLTLNLVLPENPRAHKASPLPVMVWFHGGGLLSGSASFNLYQGNWLADLGQVVVVSVQYRLGILGFFTTGSAEAPGNMGMQDQVFALQWIRDNIRNFGGDPDRVTLFGQSAGAVSAGYHILSPASVGLFHRAILQSGVPFGSAPSTEELKYQADSLGQEVNCPTSDTPGMLECLRTMPADRLADLSTKYPFAVNCDGQFLLDDPDSLWRRGQFARVPVLLGANSDDGIVFFLGNPDVLEYGISEEDLDMMVTSALSLLHYTDHANHLTTAIKSEYFSNTADPLQNARNVIDMFTELWFLAPMMRMADSLTTNGAPAFQYYFDYRPSYLQDQYDVSVGAGHGDELGLVFGAVNPDGILAANASLLDQALAFSMMRAWSSFAADGVPVYIDQEASEHQWPSYDMFNRTYVALSSDMAGNLVQGTLRERRMWFWNVLLPCLAQDDYCPTGPNPKTQPGYTELSKEQVEILMLVLGVFGVGMVGLFLLLLCCFCAKHRRMKGKTV